MTHLSQAFALLDSELQTHVPDFDRGELIPATGDQLAIVAGDCAPLELPAELLEFWGRCGGRNVAIPMLFDGEFGGETHLVPADAAFESFLLHDRARLRMGEGSNAHLYGPKNLLQIASVETMGVFAEIVPGSQVCPVWQSDVEEDSAWPVLGSIAEMVELMAASVWVTDPELVAERAPWNMGMDVAGDRRVVQPAIDVALHDRFWLDRQRTKTAITDFNAFGAMYVPWPATWLTRDR